MSTAPFVFLDRVRWSDTDPAGIMRYDAYQRFFEVAEAELFRAAGLPPGETVLAADVWLVRKVMHVEFHSPARLDEQVEIGVQVSRLGTTSLALDFAVRSAESRTPRADGHLVLVAVDKETLRKRELPAELVRKLEPFVGPSVRQSASRASGGPTPS